MRARSSSALSTPPVSVTMLLSQNLILLGLFFVIPLYLQIVQGFDAFQTGLRLLPVSITMLLSAMSGPSLGRFASPRTVVRVALLVLIIAILWLLGTIGPGIDDVSFAFAMAAAPTSVLPAPHGSTTTTEPPSKNPSTAWRW